MTDIVKYITIAIVLLLAELVYFRIAKHFGICDKPNFRSSHSRVVISGGGIVFTIGMWVWSIFFGFHYPWFLVALTLVAGVSFLDDMKALPDSVRLLVQFMAMFLMFHQMGMTQMHLWWGMIIGLIVCVGATNIYNFMDGINGMTAGYSLAVLIPVGLINLQEEYSTPSFIFVTILSVLVFAFFNFRPKGKAWCFAGDVGSIGMAFIVLFLIGRIILKTADVTWLIFLLVYGVDGCCTIVHRMMLHEHLGEAHRKHAYQIMANELKMGHVEVSLIYTGLQLAISLVMIYLIPNTVLAHWIYLVVVGALLVCAYVLFMKKYYHLHEEYLKSLKA